MSPKQNQAQRGQTANICIPYGLAYEGSKIPQTSALVCDLSDQ